MRDKGKTQNEIKDMFIFNLIKEIGEAKAHQIFMRCLSYAKNRNERSRAKSTYDRLMKKKTSSNPHIEELNMKIREGVRFMSSSNIIKGSLSSKYGTPSITNSTSEPPKLKNYDEPQHQTNDRNFKTTYILQLRRN